MSLRSWLSPSSRLAPLPFALAVIAVYVLSFGSQVLLSAPVTARLSIVPFVLAQAVLIAAWIVLHTQRLRDADRASGLAIGIAIVYALEVVLLTILIWLILASATGGSDGAGSESSILNLFVILYLLAMFSGDPMLGGLQVWIVGFIVLMLLPVAIGLGFSIWTATRKPAPPPP